MADRESQHDLPQQVRTSEPLFWLAGYGHEVRHEASYAYDCRRRQDRPHVCLQYTLAGTSFYRDKSGRSLLPAGSAFFRQIPGPFEYGLAKESACPLELVFVSLAGDLAMQWYHRLTRRFGHVLRFDPRSGIGPMLLDLIQVPKKLTDRYLLSSQIYHLLMTLYSLQNRSRLQTHPRTAHAIELINMHAHEPGFNVLRLAEKLDCSREYFSRGFRETMGVSPGDYLMQHRLKLAARQMRQTDDKLDTVARDTGFSGANYLCRVFRSRVGVTCATFRKQPWIAGP